MKKTNLKILFTALSFCALSATFGQDTSKSVTSGDSLNRSVPQASPMATDSASVNSNPVATDSTSGGYDKADKKRLKAEKKEMKAEKKEAGK